MARHALAFGPMVVSDGILRSFDFENVRDVAKPFNKKQLLARVAAPAELALSRAELLNQTAELLQANARLQSLNQAKSDFLNMAAHDIRTPVTAIVGFAKIIQKKLGEVFAPETDENRRARSLRQVIEDVGIIVSEGDRLTALINDLLDLSKMESGKLELKQEALSLPTMVDQALSATAVLAEEARLTVEKELEDNLPAVYADRHRVLEVLVNLVSNAVKFTPKGGKVTVRAHRGVGPNAGSVVVSVCDTGLGIAPENIDRIFEKFQQGDQPNASAVKGTGLGLSISKMIVERHQGRMWVQSEPGRGCTFLFTLPLAGEEGGG